MAAKLEPLNDAERKWVAGSLASTREMIAAFNNGSSEVTLPALDLAYAAWFDQYDPDTQDPNPIINAFGIAFGQYLVDELGLKWVAATDEHGTELAVHGKPNNVLVYPTNLVAKRMTKGETGFFAPLYGAMKDTISAARSGKAPPAAQTPEPARPWWKFWKG